jgi:DNA-binding GntR family transcriptional regulator
MHRRARLDRAAAGKNRRESDAPGRLSKADQIYLSLKKAIISGELLPAAAIDKNELCDRFGVSRLPVTTAVNRLAYERLVLIEPQRGSYVAKIQLDDVIQWMSARRALEVEISEEAARRLSPETIEELGRNLRYQQAALEGNDVAGFMQIDVAFHHLLVEGLEAWRLGEILDSLRSHLDRVRRLLLPEPGRMEATIAEHRAIAEAIAARRAKSAGQAMRAHLDAVLDRLIAFERGQPDFFGTMP